MKKLPLSLAVIVISLLSLAGSCAKEHSGGPVTNASDSFNIIITFRPVVDTVPLYLDTATYTNSWKEKYSVSTFKYYLSHFSFINTDSNVVRLINTDKYFLVNAADSTTWTVKLAATPYRYNRLSFLMGVDSMHNVSGAQAGALDPANGMFWTWNSGYVMAKLEGKSSVSSLVNNKMEYHIGGFKGDSSVLRQPTLLFPYGKFLEITPGRKAAITVTANVNAWFYNPHELRIRNNPSCTTPGALARDISENYSKMFTVTAITN